MNVGIIGYGVVGKAASNTLSKECTIIKYDKFLDLDSFEALIKCKFVFIMVPTPFDCKNNAVNLDSIKESLDRLESIGFDETVIIKSTVPVGTCFAYSRKYTFNIVFNPEFLRESTTPNEDFENQNVVVIGTPTKSIFISVKTLFESVLDRRAEYFHTSYEEAEMIKLAQNTMLASRVAIANMIFDACQKNGVDYDKVKKIAFDKFDILGPHMAQVPGPDGNRGFGGKCLPKDIRAFSTVSNSDLLNSIIKYNDSLRDDLHNFLMNYKK